MRVRALVTLLHMFGELFNQSFGVKMIHIPYLGFSQAIEDLISGRLNLLFAGYAAVAEYLTANDPDKLIALGITNHGRSPLAPEIPTLDELGYKNVDSIGSYGVYRADWHTATRDRQGSQEITPFSNCPM